MALAGMGAIADALSDVALGYTEGLLKPTREQLERERELKIQKQAEEIATAKTVQDLNKAHAAYYELGRPGGGNPYRIIKDPKTGAMRRYNLLTNELDDAFTEGKPDTPLKGRERVTQSLIGILEKHYGKPLEELSQEEMNHPDVADTVELLRLRDDIVSGPTGFTRRRWIPKEPPAPKGKAVPAVDPTDRTAATPPAESKPAQTESKPEVTPPAKAPGAPADTPKQKPLSRNGPLGGKSQVIEAAVQVQIPGYEGLNESQLQTQLDDLTKRQADSPSNITLTQLEAVRRVLAKKRSGVTGEAQPPTTAQPPTKTDKGTGDATVRIPGSGARPTANDVIAEHVKYWKGKTDAEITAHYDLVKKRYDKQPGGYDKLQLEALDQVRKSRQPAVPDKPAAAVPTPPVPPKPTTKTTGEVPTIPVYQTEPQRQAELDKAEDQQMQRDNAARAQAQLEVTLRNEKFEHEKNAQRLREYEEAKQAKNLAAQERIEKNILLETREYKAQIAGANETIALMKEMAKYVTPETVGARGAVRQVWQNLMGQFERHPTAKLTGEAGQIQGKIMPIAGKLVQQAKVWQADENVRAREEGRIPDKIYIPDFSKHGYDPSMTFIAFLKEVIGYAQARAMNGIGRLTDQDLDRAKFALGIDSWTKSAAHVQTSLLYVSQQLEDKKVRVQAEIDAIDRQLRRHAPKAGAAGAETGEPAKE